MGRRSTWIGLAAGAAMIVGVGTAQAAGNLVLNGDFDATTLTTSHEFSGNQVTDWTNATTSGYSGTGYNFLILPGTADTTGFVSNPGNHDTIWGPGNGPGSANYSANGAPATSPTGGNYLLADGDANFRGAISQNVTGLTAGQTYALTFYWAGAQFTGYNGMTTEAWQVGFGNSSQTTSAVTTLSHAFSPWQKQVFTFVADNTSDVLSFLAIGTPNGSPPSVLLDGVSLVAAPEPATWALFGVGLLATAVFTRRKRSRSTSAV